MKLYMNKSEILTPENIDKILMIVYDSDVEKVLTINRAEFKKHLMENISERDFAVLYKRIVEGKTLEEAGHDMQVTRERVRQVEARALRRLRAPYTSRRYEALTVKEVSELEESLASATKMNNQLQKQCELHHALLERLLGRRSQTLQAVTGSMQGLDALIQSIDELGLSTRTCRALKRAGIETVGQLADMSDQQLSAIRNLGVKSKQEAQEKLKAYLDRRCLDD